MGPVLISYRTIIRPLYHSLMGSIFFLVVVFCIINGVLDVIIYGKSREAGLEARSPVSQAVYFTPAYAKVHIL